MFEVCFGGSDIVFQGWEDDCWKFLLGFAGVNMRTNPRYDIMGFNGDWSNYGVIQITEIEVG